MSNPTPLWYLKNYNLFAGLSEKEIGRIAGQVTMTECNEGACSIYEPYQAAENIYIVKKGEVQLYHLRDGKRYVFDTLGPGSLCGNINMTPQPYGHFAQAGRGSCVCAFTKAQFLEILRQKPELMLSYMQHMSAKVQEYQQQMQNHQSSADEIVFNELQRLHAKRQQNFLGQIIARPLRATHEQLSELTGLNRVTVTRSMKRLRDQGDLTYDPKTGIIDLID